VRLWDTENGDALLRLGQGDWVNAVAFSPDGSDLASAGDDDTARIWDAESGRELTRMSHDHDVEGVAFSPDGRWVATASLDRTGRVWDAASGRELIRVSHDKALPDRVTVGRGSRPRADLVARWVWNGAMVSFVASLLVALTAGVVWVASGTFPVAIAIVAGVAFAVALAANWVSEMLGRGESSDDGDGDGGWLDGDGDGG
jgi:WD40 repeat protein